MATEDPSMAGRDAARSACRGNAMRHVLLSVLLLCLVGAAPLGCRGSRDAPTDEAAAEEASASTPARERARSAGLVGPGAVEAPTIDVVDVGPPSPVVLFTSSLLGYTEPCGCSLDLVLGGLDRVTGFARAAMALGTDSIMLDAGNLFFEHPELDAAAREQEVRKTQVLLAAHRALGTAATVPGPTDLANGLGWYLEQIASSPMTLLAANLQGEGGLEIGRPWIVRPLGEERLAVIGAVDPDVFAGMNEVAVTDARPAVNRAIVEAREAGATITLLLYQGDIRAARRDFDTVEGLDFVVIGNQPRHTDRAERIGSAWSLEAYDQGRTVGRLKLVNQADGADASWTSARRGSDEEIARLQRLIESIDEQLDALGAGREAADDEAPIVTRQRERRAEYQQEIDAMQGAEVSFPEGARTFLWTPVAMEPGLPVHEAITAEMVAYNEALRAINLRTVETIAAVPEGHASYVGGAVCATCHPGAHAFWEQTAHATAIQTLIDRTKEFDRNCIGCHVTGYREPGGSVLGDLRGLENVQCEQCHGPGSLHATNPTQYVNVPHGVRTDVPEGVCVACHNEEHSVHFEYGTYLSRIVGEGHGARR
jgi:hypothetical protein